MLHSRRIRINEAAWAVQVGHDMPSVQGPGPHMVQQRPPPAHPLLGQVQAVPLLMQQPCQVCYRHCLPCPVQLVCCWPSAASCEVLPPPL